MSYGITEQLKQKFLKDLSPTKYLVGRILSASVDTYLVYSDYGIRKGKISGSYHYRYQDIKHYPKVGDYVILTNQETGDFYIIKELCPRYSTIGHSGEYVNQIVATNVDKLFIMSPLDKEPNINSIRNLVLISEKSNVEPIILLTKSDLCSNYQEVRDDVLKQLGNYKVIAISTIKETGMEELSSELKANITVAFVGYSGVGKSTLFNYLSASALMKVSEVNEKTKKGRHTTSMAMMIELENKTIIIDTPGIKALGLSISNQPLSKGGLTRKEMKRRKIAKQYDVSKSRLKEYDQ